MEVMLGRVARDKAKLAEDGAAAMETIDSKLRKQIEDVNRIFSGRKDDTTAKTKSVEQGPVEPTNDGGEFVILTDSNGMGVTQDTVKRHVPKQKHGKYASRST
jgi:uncharacterized protein YhfF